MLRLRTCGAGGQDNKRHSNMLTYSVGRLNDRHNDIKSDGKRHNDRLTYSYVSVAIMT